MNATPLPRPVFIVGAHKSGTSLLRSLLDGHPDLAVLPREPHFFERSGLRVSYSLRPAPARHGWTHERFGAHVVAELSKERRHAGPYSDSPGWRGYDPERFASVWSERTSTTDRDRYIAYLAALWAAAGYEPTTARMVDKSTEYLEFVPLLSKWFPNACFVHLLRNPYANLVAIRRYHRRRDGGRTGRLTRSVQAVRLSFECATRYEQQQLPGYRLIRYEDLVESPETQMRRIADALGIEFDPLLLSPTMEGRPWTGNSGDDVQVAAIRREPSQHWRDELHPVDVRLVDRALHGLPRFGYGHAQAAGRLITRLPGETAAGWLVNRVRSLVRV